MKWVDFSVKKTSSMDIHVLTKSMCFLDLLYVFKSSQKMFTKYCYTGGHNCVRFLIVSFNFLLNVNVLSLGV